MNIDPEKALAELRWLGLAVCADTTRSSICHVHVDADRAVATDGHRLHFTTGSVLPAGFSIRASDLALVQELAKSYLPQLLELQEDGGTHWFFESTNGTAELRFHPDEYEFPPYQNLVPAELLGTEMLRTDARKAIVGEGERPDYCVFQCSKEGETAHFNARYIAEALKGAPKKVNAFLPADDSSPIMFRYENRGALVMPIRK